MTTYAPAVKRSQQEYDDMAFALMCLERGLPRTLRLRAGLTQDAMAVRVGTTQPDIHRWEGGGNPTYHRRPNLTDLDKLARYGRTLRELAQETGLVETPA